MSFIAKIKDLLFHPDAFFAPLEDKEPNLILPILIVMLTGIGSVMAFGILMFLTGPAAGRSILETLTMLPTSYPILSAFIIPFLLWAVTSVSIYLVSRKVSGTGSLKTTFQNVGYGTLPTALYGAIFEIMFITLNSVSPPTEGGSFTFVMIFWMLSLSPIVFMLWSWYLWVAPCMHTGSRWETRSLWLPWRLFSSGV
ncbi:MAG: Yip1 family protein [Methanoregula sp.]|nr:Yip1 family protein [Methanoregula sp.]